MLATLEIASCIFPDLSSVDHIFTLTSLPNITFQIHIVLATIKIYIVKVSLLLRILFSEAKHPTSSSTLWLEFTVPMKVLWFFLSLILFPFVAICLKNSTGELNILVTITYWYEWNIGNA